MKSIAALQHEFLAGTHHALLRDIYLDETKLAYQANRYAEALTEFTKLFDATDVRIFSAPGRSEIGGNHTDHQHGEVLAASINQDAIAIAAPVRGNIVRILSKNYPMFKIDLNALEKGLREEGTTLALIKGVLSKLQENGHKLGGFDAYVTSDVLGGSGLSSSAAFETLIGTIVSGLYNDMHISPIEIAAIGQYAENVYFGKPCGLMDQMACSVGGLIHIDFADPAKPVVEQISYDFEKEGCSLCITDTKGSHADLTSDYAAVPAEMKDVAAFFEKEVLHEVSEDALLANIAKLREKVSDRAVLRALHFFNENKRVQKEVTALRTGNFKGFLQAVKASGASSFQFLQNVYTSHDIAHQNMSLALCISEMVLGEQGVCRVHGGGFAGTIQAFVPNHLVTSYQAQLDAVFGAGSCSIFKIRKYGGILVL